MILRGQMRNFQLSPNCTHELRENDGRIKKGALKISARNNGNGTDDDRRCSVINLRQNMIKGKHKVNFMTTGVLVGDHNAIHK